MTAKKPNPLAVAFAMGPAIRLAAEMERSLAQVAEVMASVDPRPCRGINSNICVAEGCYGETCREVEA